MGSEVRWEGLCGRAAGILQGEMLVLRTKPSPTLANVLRRTLARLCSSPEVDRDDPALRMLKRSIVRALAELEVRKADTA